MAAGTLYVEIVAPDKNAFRGEAVSFRAPGVAGSFEVLYNHAPMVAATGVGQVTIRTASGDEVHFATSGGFVEVLDNRVIMLTEAAEPVGEIDLERAQAAEQRAAERMRESLTPEERAAAEAELERARNRARLALGSVGSGR
jgi:F-type H+-transporting ATPase subunit epsilon